MAVEGARGGGCLAAAAALVLGVAGLLLTPLVLFQQANGVTLDRPLAYAGVPMDEHGGQWGVHQPPQSCGSGSPELPPVPLAPPVDGTVSSTFGWRPNPTGWGWDCHTGVDWAADMGTPVRAAAAGTVVTAGDAGNYGILVRIEHGQGWETWYGHLSAATVRPGQAVPAGAVIGRVGNTGRSTGPHLHFEVRVGGRPTAPLAALGKDGGP